MKPFDTSALREQMQAINASVDETNRVREEQRAQAVEREEAVIGSLGLLADLAKREHEDAMEREAVAEKRHAEALEIARRGVFWARVAGVLSAVAIVATIIVAL